MRKTKRLLIIALMAVAMIMLFATTVKAEPLTTVSIQSINIESPETGTYGVGQKIKVVVTYSEDIQQVAQGGATTADSIKYKFGTGTEKEVSKGTLSGNTLTYEITIAAGDTGLLQITEYSITYSVQSDSLNAKESNGTAPTATGSVITAGTVPAGGDGDGLTWTDASNMEIKTSFDGGEYPFCKIKASGLTTIANHEYYVFFTSNTTAPTYSIDNIDYDETLDTLLREQGMTADKYYELASDTYLWVLETQRDSNLEKKAKFIVSAKKVEWPAQKKLGTRLLAYFFNDYTDTFFKEPHTDRETIQVKLKVGKVNDINILRSIQRGDADCLSKLLTYAKSAESNYTGTVPLGMSGAVAPQMNLTNEGYYYVYMVVDDGTGAYRTVEDVSLYQAFVTPETGSNLWDYLDENFKWNLPEEGGSGEITPLPSTPQGGDGTTLPGVLPQTGQKFIIALSVVGVIVLAVVFAKKAKKYTI